MVFCLKTAGVAENICPFNWEGEKGNMMLSFIMYELAETGAV